MNRLICFLLGHKYNPDWAMYYEHFWCERCGFDNPENPSRLDQIRWRLLQLYREQLEYWSRKRWREWWKCPDCGWRCGRHNPNTDHVPF